MRIALLILFGLLFSNKAMAGVEFVLVKDVYGDCIVRITHDATPDADEGTLVFRSYIVEGGIHAPCDVDPDQVEQSLRLALSRYLARADLKPVTSIFVGKIAGFPWVRNIWAMESHSGSFEPLSHREFNQRVMASDIYFPFKRALHGTGLKITESSCEKLQFHANGAPMDALCWFVIADE